MFDLVVRNARLADGAVADIAASNGKFVLVSDASSGVALDARTTIDAAGLLALPGLTDTHVHLNPPFGRGVKDATESESRAAAAGGVTTIGNIVLRAEGDLVAHVNDFKKMIDDVSYVDIALTYPILSRDQVEQMDDLFDLGVSTFKAFRVYKSTDVHSFGGADDGLLYRIMCKVADMRKRGKNALLKLHCENDELATEFRAEYESKYPDLGLDEPLTDVTWAHCRPDIVEAESVSSALFLAKQTNCPIMILHVSSALSLDLIRRARAEGVECYVETTPLYLLTNAYKTGCEHGPLWTRVQPSVKFDEDSEALWEAIADGTVDVIGTDHAATRKEIFAGKSVWDGSAGGRSVLAISLPLMLNAMAEGRIRLDQLVSLMCTGTARAMGLSGVKGEIKVGADADLVLVDPNEKRVVTAESLHSFSDHSVFEGRELQGWPKTTVVRGTVVWQDGKETGNRPGLFTDGHGVPAGVGSVPAGAVDGAR